MTSRAGQRITLGPTGLRGQPGAQGPSGSVLPGSLAFSKAVAPVFADVFTVFGINDNVAPTGWQTVTVHDLSAQGYCGAYISGFAAPTDPTVATVRILGNLSVLEPDGVITLLHKAGRSAHDNACPDDHDYILAKGQYLPAIWNPGDSCWHFIASARSLRTITHALGFYPILHMVPITGTVDAYDGPVLNAGNRTAPSGQGVAGSPLKFKDATHVVLSTVDASGAIIKGIKFIGHVDPDASGWGHVWMIENDGPGAITLQSQAAGSTNDRIWCPGDVDYVLLPNATVFVQRRDQGGVGIVGQGIQPTQAITSLTTTVEGYTGAITPAALTGGGATTNDWNPWGVALDGSGNGIPDHSLIRVQTTGGTANLTGLIGPGVGSNKWPKARLMFYAGTLVLKNDNVGSLVGNRLYGPGYADFTQRFFGFVDIQYDPLLGHWMPEGA